VLNLGELVADLDQPEQLRRDYYGLHGDEPWYLAKIYPDGVVANNDEDYVHYLSLAIEPVF